MSRSFAALPCLSLAASVCVVFMCLPVLGQEPFTPLLPLSFKIVANAQAYPGGRHEPGNLNDGNPGTEYASNNKGTNTFVEVDFGGPRGIVAFRYVDRNDPATVAESELTFFDPSGAAFWTTVVKHPTRRGATTFSKFHAPILNAERVKWRVTKLGSAHGTVGGAELEFFGSGPREPLPSSVSMKAETPQLLERARPAGNRDGQSTTRRPLQARIDYPYLESTDATVRCGAIVQALRLEPGRNEVELLVPATSQPARTSVQLEVAGKRVSQIALELQPVRNIDIFILPHSHVDIGYTALQADVEKKQNTNLETGLRLAKESAAYPEGARFKWNVEVLWPVENYLRAASPEKRAEFVAAVKARQIGLDALYCNILTGLCRPEELVRLMSYAGRLSDLCGVPVESAMISDVPGYTWSTVSAMAQAGVRYFSFAPNYFDRMGGTMKEWQNKPFWWKGPDGQSRVLCWCPSRGYALGHIIGDGEALARFIPGYLVELQKNGYPYDITHLRWNVHGDNGSPDEKVADVVRAWNERYASPRLRIATTAEAFREFERKYGARLPEYSGDYTPYWEDGAASSARETGLNRASAERLVQAETLWAMRSLGPFPAAEFHEAWRNVLLYSEHTWGAHNSISQPDLAFVKDQWKVKQGFALDADKQSRLLLELALGEGSSQRGATDGAIEVINTSSWERTDLVIVPGSLAGSSAGVADEKGRPLVSQRLSTGELVFVARDVPALGCRRYQLGSAPPPRKLPFQVEDLKLVSPEYAVRIDGQTGAIVALYDRINKRDLVDSGAATAINDYFYLPGADVKAVQKNARPRVRVKEMGPVLGSLVIESDAPGCKLLAREVRLIAGIRRVEIFDLVDKLAVRSKEGVHFGFGFNVPDATMRIDVGWAAVRPEADQIPASCKNWFSVQRWLDISNPQFGVTWSPIDAPLVELGGLTANLIGSQTDYRVWLQHLEPTQTFYSWVMNNHWHTNYRADQEGPTVFRYALCGHGRFDAVAAARFGAGASQPLLVARSSPGKSASPRVRVSSDQVLVTAFKPADDGKAQIVRLFGASGKGQKVKLTWEKPAPQRLFISNTAEKPVTRTGNTIEVPGWGIVTVRAEF